MKVVPLVISAFSEGIKTILKEVENMSENDNLCRNTENNFHGQ